VDDKVKQAADFRLELVLCHGDSLHKKYKINIKKSNIFRLKVSQNPLPEHKKWGIMLNIMKKLLYLMTVIPLILSSCPDGRSSGPDIFAGNFWVHNFATNTRYKIYADKLVEGVNCTVWVQRNSSATKAMAQNIAREFDNEISIKLLDIFSVNFDIDEQVFDTLAYADYLGDRDEKLCILLLNIDSQDGAYVSGYFWPEDLSNGTYSNNRDMIYINVSPGFSITEEMETIYKAIAHEFQHLLNFVTKNDAMDVWIDEGLALSAEWIYTGKHLTDRITWYEQSGNFRESSLIEKGNNFFVWGNRTDEYKNAEQDDYATVYLFFQWLRLQSGGTDIFYDILTSEYTDYRSVTDAAASKMSAAYNDWAYLLRDWLAANYFNSSSGLYGYNGEDDLASIKAHFLPVSGKTYPLYPGEGVYSFVSSNMSVPNSTGNIEYRGMRISNTDSIPTLYEPGGQLYSTGNQNALLSYNVNTDVNNTRENGTVTGAVPSASILPSSVSIVSSSVRSVGISSRPLPISARDMLRRNGF
jgi:hypothetical protein